MDEQDIKYLVTFMHRMAGEGISVEGLEEPMDWVVRKWAELGGGPNAEFTEADFVQIFTRPTPKTKGAQ